MKNIRRSYLASKLIFENKLFENIGGVARIIKGNGALLAFDRGYAGKPLPVIRKQVNLGHKKLSFILPPPNLIRVTTHPIVGF